MLVNNPKYLPNTNTHTTNTILTPFSHHLAHTPHTRTTRTVTRATFTLVACQKIGNRLYLQMDLDVPCYEAEHMAWVYNVCIPAVCIYVIGKQATKRNV